MSSRFNALKAIDALRDARAGWLGSSERLVLAMLVSHARGADGPNAGTDVDQRAGIARPSQGLLSAETGLSARTVWAALDALVREGAIVVAAPGRQHQPTRYCLMATTEALRLATIATLNAASVAPVATLKARQTRNIERPDSQDRTSRLAPVANEGTKEGTKEKEPNLVASATEALQLEAFDPIAPTKTPSDHQRVVAAYAEAYAERTGGTTPKRIGPEGGRAVKELIASYGPGEACAIVARGVREWSKGIPLLPTIAKYADGFRGPATPPKLRAGNQPKNGSTWKSQLDEEPGTST